MKVETWNESWVVKVFPLKTSSLIGEGKILPVAELMTIEHKLVFIPQIMSLVYDKLGKPVLNITIFADKPTF